MHLAIIGYGNIAQSVLRWLAARPVDQLSVLTRPAARKRVQQDKLLSAAAHHVFVTDSMDEMLAGHPDLVVECAGHQAVIEYAPKALKAGVDLVLVSIGAMADERLSQALKEAAIAGGGKLILPAGAIGGIDLLAALSLAGEVAVKYRGTKPPAAWRGTPAERATDLDNLSDMQVIFDGTARQAATEYPRNANVAATLALAGAGFDATRVELIADPAARGNRHAYDVACAAGRFTVQIDNAASPENARTSVATIYSVAREINRKRDPVII
ncbi:aspartate dehydrogenase [Roseobacter sp. YSTF-M11]|uniref:L-aspartate dehydrogenase n=1 Tax=Roseobacter insulae TaxID=2859783 RepID=A0A9X1FWK6_9RHOB|nr:aspartate dehydrogenase [Roseobacter insulae]MBW4708967.1 aspartate dehydrogenase [Roseobacter insulae]